MTHATLVESMIRLSAHAEWEHARLEWSLERVFESDEGETCLCGHHPIHDACVFRNRVSGQEALLGKDCSKHFMLLDVEALFNSAKSARANLAHSLCDASLEHALGQGWLSSWELAFYRHVRHKRMLSLTQTEKKKEINARFADAMKGRIVRTCAPRPIIDEDDPMPWRSEED